MSAVLALLVGALGAPASPGPAATAPAATISGTRVPAARTGLLGLGLGLELPMVGVTTGVAGGGASHGYNFGAALSWELLPELLVRGHGAVGQAFGAHAPVRYDEGATRARRRQDATWSGVEIGGGLAYVFRGADRDWAPFVGAGAGALFGGYDYDFAADDPLTEQAPSVGSSERAATDVHEALGWSWIAGVRAGLQLTILRWLASQAELSVSYWEAPRAEVTNTYTSLRVKSEPEGVWLVRAAFSVRLGL